MYSHELLEFIKKNNYLLNRNELLKVIDIKENPQITSIKYDDNTKRYYIKTDDNYSMDFGIIPYNEIDSKKLKKSRN